MKPRCTLRPANRLSRDVCILSTRKSPRKAGLKKRFDFYGAGERSRTSDLLITNQLLYQLSYTGVGARRVWVRGKAKYKRNSTGGGDVPVSGRGVRDARE